jgi:hypothetical protein
MTMEPTPAQYEQDRLAAYDRILGVVQKHIDSLEAPLTVSLVAISPSAARDTAEREVWKLFHNGIQHLKDGGQKNSAGSFAEAVSKASLRSAPMAATLGVKPPKFDENYYNVQFDSGAAEAWWRSRRLLEAVASDAPKSHQLIRQKLAFTEPLSAPEKGDGVNDPELRGVFDAALKSSSPKDADNALLVSLRRQTVLSFNFMSDNYVSSAVALKREIEDLFQPPAPKPGLKGQSFDL